MRSLNRLLVVLAACAAGAALAAGVASADRAKLPPNGVYTCKWIAAHPLAAAQARVTCDASVFFAAMSSPISGPSAAILASPDSIDSTGCWYIPAGARISPGVYAWSAWEYANDWSWFANFGPPVDYTWYIQKSGPVTLNFDRVTDLGHADHNHALRYPTGNVRRLGFQNWVYPTQQWYHCHTQAP